MTLPAESVAIAKFLGRETRLLTKRLCALYTIRGTVAINVAMLPSHTPYIRLQSSLITLLKL